MLDQTREKLAWIAVQGVEDPGQRGQPDVADAALHARDLHGGQPGALGQLFLRPASGLSRLLEVSPKPLDGIHPRIVRGLDRFVQNQIGKSPRDERGLSRPLWTRAVARRAARWMKRPSAAPQGSVVLSREQRVAVRLYISAHLDRIEALWIAIAIKDHKTADELAVAYSDELRLVAEDLGWGSGPPEEESLRTPRDVLFRLFTRLRRDQDQVKQELVEGLDDDERLGCQVIEAADEVLAQLDGGGSDA